MSDLGVALWTGLVGASILVSIYIILVVVISDIVNRRK